MTLEQIRKTASFIRDKVSPADNPATGHGAQNPDVGIILGTGLGGLVEAIDIKASIDYRDIPDFPVSTVEGHTGRLVFGTLGGKRVVAMQGRFHFYEGYTPAQVVFPVRVMKLLGITTLLVSNASGGVNPSLKVGDIMAITDHINLLPNPLIGPNIDELGPRFPDMHASYDPALLTLAKQVAAEQKIELKQGVYVGTTGPTFETQAEYGYFRAIGGDAVGMSTTPEVIAARHMGLKVFGASVITDEGFSPAPTDHAEVQKTGAAAGAKMAKLFIGILESL